MTIKVGDKVKCVNEYSSKFGKIGIVVKIKNLTDIIVYFEVTEWQINLNDLELVEIAHYVPVPKFKIGDIVYDKNGKKYLILEDRENDLSYHCWFYANYIDVGMDEEELTLEEPKEQPKDE